MRYKTKKRIFWTILGLLLAYFTGVGVGYDAGAKEAFEHAAICEQQGGASFMLGHNVNCLY